MKRVTATEASRSFARLLDETEHQRETFIIERRGRPIAEVRPAERSGTIADLIALLERGPPDDEWERDMREIIADRDRHVATDRFDWD